MYESAVRLSVISAVLLRLLTLLALLSVTCPIAAATERWQALAEPLFLTPRVAGRTLTGPVSAISQDQNGFIWLVADHQLWRWDAHEFRPVNVTPPAGSNVAIEITALKADADGNLWLASSHGLYRTGRNHAIEAIAPEQLAGLSILELAIQGRGDDARIYLSTDRNVLIWQVREQKLLPLPLPELAPDTRIHSLHLDPQGTLWVGTGKGLYQLANTAVRLEQVDIPGQPRIAALHTDSSNQLWIGTAKAGVFIRRRTGELSTLRLADDDGNEPWIYRISELRPGIVWLGSFGKGIYQIDSATLQQRRLRHNRLQPYSLADDEIWTLFRDRTGLLWIGHSTGVNLLDANQFAVQTIFGDIGAEHGLSDTTVHAVLADAEHDTLWAGTASKGIDILHPERARVGQWRPSQRIGNTELRADPVETLYRDQDGSVLAANNFQILRIAADQQHVQTLAVPGRAADAFASAFVRFNQQRWIGGPDGLWRVTDDGLNSENVFSSASINRRVASLLADHDSLWVGSWQGLARLQFLGTPPAYAVTRFTDPALTQQFITAMVRDRQNRIWVGTSSAGVFYQSLPELSATSPWQRLDERHGLPGRTVASLQLDAADNLWLSTSRGIARIDTTTLAIQSLSREEGAAVAPYLRGAGTVTGSGEIVFGGATGITIIQPNKWRPRTFTAPLVISAIDTDGHPAGQLSTSAAPTAALVLPPTVSRVAIEFAALDYTAANQIRYRYRLLGFSERWQEADANHRTATFTALAPQQYELQAQYSYDGQHWSPTPLRLQLEVRPAWHQTGLLRTLLVIGAMLLLYGLYRLRTQVLRLRQQQLEHHIAARTADLAEANERLQQQALALAEASLNDPLTGLRNRRFLNQHIDADVAILNRRHLDHAHNAQPLPADSDLIFYLIDIDHFKQVNDKWGHAAGDAVLIEMRQRLLKVFREADYLIRWGGEEFLVAARYTERGNANELAQRIRQAVTEQPFAIHADQAVPVTCSIGYAVYPLLTDRPDGLSWAETIAIADLALYTAKHAGRDTWIGFTGAANSLTAAAIDSLKSNPASAFSLLQSQTRRS